MENNLSIVKDQFKELPNNIEAEQAVIGSILVSNDIFDEISTIISSINFYDPMHQKIFEAIESLIYKGMLANPITLKNQTMNCVKNFLMHWVIEIITRNNCTNLIEYIIAN